LSLISSKENPFFTHQIGDHFFLNVNLEIDIWFGLVTGWMADPDFG
jgi:hypothetical protein